MKLIDDTLTPFESLKDRQSSGQQPNGQSLDDLALVSRILDQIKANGDSALRRFCKEFDRFEGGSLRVTEAEFEAAESAVPEKLKEILKTAKANIEAYHRHQLPMDWSFSPSEGVWLGQRIRPIRRVALYIPGGKAAYPSTVLMNGIPARIAGVKALALFTPPGPDGRVNDLVLYAASLLGIEEVYKIGGAQAIGAAAYGTESIEAVDKIVGPGNRFVALAKKLVFGDVAIDMIAGPSEVLIVADDSARPDWIAADLLAQAEHDEDAALYLVTTCKDLPKQVMAALDAQLSVLPKAAIASAALQQNFSVYLAADLKRAMTIANGIAPEHLELMVAEPEALLEQVDQAGSVFLGAYTPEALGDYWAGTNHTLPTSGTARFSSPLGVYDFIKRPSFLSYSREALKAAGTSVEAFAAAEGLEAHRASVAIRLAENTP